MGYRYSLGLAAALACGISTTVVAEVHVDGSPAALRITTSRDAISDVLSAFGENFKVRYRTFIPLDAPASAAYSGSLGQVIARLLDGYNYVIKKDQDTTEIIVFGRRGDAAIAPPPPKAPAPKGILSRWR